MLFTGFDYSGLCWHGQHLLDGRAVLLDFLCHLLEASEGILDTGAAPAYGRDSCSSSSIGTRVKCVRWRWHIQSSSTAI